MADSGQMKKKRKETKDQDENISVKDNAFFKQMLDLIPTHFYFDNAAKDRLHAKRSRADDEKDEDEEITKSKVEWKRAKFDPKALTSVTELQEQLVSDENEHSKGMKKKKKNKMAPRSPGMESTMPSLAADEMSASLSLQQRFQAKLQALKEKRTGLSNKREESMEKKRLKRKISRLKQKQKQKHPKSPLPNGDSKSPLTDAKLKASPAKPLYNKDGNIVFSKFDFTDQGESNKKSEAPTGKNYKQLLEKAQKRKEKAKALKETDKDAAKLLEEKNQWQTVLQKAEGVKVKDDVELLKKSVKRKEKLKKRSKTKWDGRVERVEQKKKDKQEKRKTNIKKKKDGRINKKISKSKKKGHIIPGF